jgi:Peptidase M10 serralysin C terminal
MGNDSFNAFSASGAVNAVSSSDLAAMDVIGWDRTATGSSSQPTGVAISPATRFLASAQSSAGLAANISLATVTQIGGLSSDSYSFALGGTGAAAFGLSTTANTGTLSGGASGVAGSVNGRAYGLTLSATDLNSGLSSAPAALVVVVGSSGGDTVSVAALVGSASTGTPTFVYGLAGADQVNATGMTSKLWITGGAGADTFTGGTGVNDYLYGATGDSTSSVLDMITNFHAATDLIDLTGLSVALQFAGKITTTTLAADSIGWQVSSGNTFAYVNTSTSAESLTGTNMKIELRGGSIPLTSGNFPHA